MFRLTEKKCALIRPQTVITSQEVIEKKTVKGMRSKTVTASLAKKNTAITPFAFSEHGVTMLASVLKVNGL